MAYILTPRFAPAHQAPQCSPFGFCAPVSRPAYTYHIARPRPQRPQHPTFSQFFNQVDELLTEIDREAQRQTLIEAQREAHRQRQQRKHALRANFAVEQIEHGWQINGELRGFEQENISIEIRDDNTLKISGNTNWQAETGLEEPQNQPETDAANVAEQVAVDPSDKADSDTESHKSYQATVEDDFEDLGAETSSLLSSSSSRASTSTETQEPKGKEQAVGRTTAETQIADSTKPEATVQSEAQQEERIHGSFERTFRFSERIDGTNISASFKDGALTIRVPRAQVPQARRIAIL